MRGVIWKNEKNPTMDGWAGNVPKTSHTIIFKYWRLHDVRKIEAPFVSWRVHLQKLCWQLFKFFTNRAQCAFKEKVWFLLKKNQLWVHVSWKWNGNSKIPNKHFETPVQGDYRQNLRGIGLLIMKLNTVEDYQKCSKITVSFFGN